MKKEPKIEEVKKEEPKPITNIQEFKEA